MSYDGRTLERARIRGYNITAHREALVSGNEDQITLTHPSNWLTEQEVEDISNCSICASPSDMKPPHFASPRCQSGGYTHCSCDACF